MRVQERKTIGANFRALLGTNTIASARWQLWTSGVASLSDPEIDGPVVTVRPLIGFPGRVDLRCTVTLSNGDIYAQNFVLDADGPYYSTDASPSGPLDVTVEA